MLWQHFLRGRMFVLPKNSTNGGGWGDPEAAPRLFPQGAWLLCSVLHVLCVWGPVSGLSLLSVDESGLCLLGAPWLLADPAWGSAPEAPCSGLSALVARYLIRVVLLHHTIPVRIHIQGDLWGQTHG